MRGEGSALALALLAAALEGFVNGFAEGVPEFLFQAPVEQGNGLCFGLPGLLQGLDGVDAQWGGGEFAGFGDEGAAARDALFLRIVQGGAGSFKGSFPVFLQLGVELGGQAPGVGFVKPAAAEGGQLFRLFGLFWEFALKKFQLPTPQLRLDKRPRASRGGADVTRSRARGFAFRNVSASS